MTVSALQLALSGLAPPLVALQVAVTGLAPVTPVVQGYVGGGAKRVEQVHRAPMRPAEQYVWRKRIEPPGKKTIPALASLSLLPPVVEYTPEIQFVVLPLLQPQEPIAVVLDLPPQEAVKPAAKKAKPRQIEEAAPVQETPAEGVAQDEAVVAPPVVPSVVAADTQAVRLQAVPAQAIEEEVAQAEQRDTQQTVALDLKKRNHRLALLAAIILYEQQD